MRTTVFLIFLTVPFSVIPRLPWNDTLSPTLNEWASAKCNWFLLNFTVSTIDDSSSLVILKMASCMSIFICSTPFVSFIIQYNMDGNTVNHLKSRIDIDFYNIGMMSFTHFW